MPSTTPLFGFYFCQSTFCYFWSFCCNVFLFFNKPPNFFSPFPVVKHVKKDERKYYEDLLKYSRDHLMLYPYHLSDIMVKGLRVTPFSYYTGIMEVSKCWVLSYRQQSCPRVRAGQCRGACLLWVGSANKLQVRKVSGQLLVPAGFSLGPL